MASACRARGQGRPSCWAREQGTDGICSDCDGCAGGSRAPKRVRETPGDAKRGAGSGRRGFLWGWDTRGHLELD